MTHTNVNPYPSFAIVNALGNGSPLAVLMDPKEPLAMGPAYITPELAERIVSNKTCKIIRKQYKDKVREYKQAMTSGNWSRDFPLSFVVLRGHETEWFLANGTHRLLALSGARIDGLCAQVTIHYAETIEEVQRIVNGFDNGKNRSNADKLMVGGYGNVPDLGLFGGCLGAASYGFRFAKSLMEHTDIVNAAEVWEKPYLRYHAAITNLKDGDIAPATANYRLALMTAKLRTNVVASVGMVTYSNRDPKVIELADRFWRGLRTLNARGDTRLQNYITAAENLFAAVKESALDGKNPLRNDAGRAKLCRQMCALWNDWATGKDEAGSLTEVSDDTVATVFDTGLAGVDMKWSSDLKRWVPISE